MIRFHFVDRDVHGFYSLYGEKKAFIMTREYCFVLYVGE